MKELYVSKTGTINTITKALELCDGTDTTIIVDEGIYYEKLKTNKDNITIKGICKEKTIISYNDFSKKLNNDGFEYNTFRTPTVTLLGNNIRLENLTIENSCIPSEKYHQAVSLAAVGDKISVFNCNILGGQDTLFVGALPLDLIDRYQSFLDEDFLAIKGETRQYFENCYIEGDVDFIFGSGNSVFYKCNIKSIGQKGYVTAPSTYSNQEFGLTFIECNLISNGIPNSFYLSRPWRENSIVIFKDCKMDDHIKPEGFSKWNNTERHITSKFMEYGNNLKRDLKNNIYPYEKINIDYIFKNWNPKQ